MDEIGRTKAKKKFWKDEVTTTRTTDPRSITNSRHRSNN